MPRLSLNEDKRNGTPRSKSSGCSDYKRKSKKGFCQFGTTGAQMVSSLIPSSEAEFTQGQSHPCRVFEFSVEILSFLLTEFEVSLEVLTSKGQEMPRKTKTI